MLTVVPSLMPSLAESLSLMIDTHPSSDYSWTLVNTVSQLEALVARWRNQEWITLDTEFVRTDTFYPKVGLIQVADQEACYLIDPLAIKDLSSLAGLIGSPRPLKVLHSMSEDIEVFRYLLGTSPVGVFDTQIAGAMLGMGLAVGYQSLVHQEMGVLLDKEETRSNWLQRPLTTRQQAYAARDVGYLADLYPALRERLRLRGLDDAVEEESGLLVRQSEPGDADFDAYYLKFRGAWRYPLQKQRVLQVLASWRERNAREQNLPRGQLLSDVAILAIADRQPKNIHVLRQIKELPSRVVQRYGDPLIELIGQAVTGEKAEPFERIARPLGGRALELYRQLKEYGAAVAEREQIAAELLARKKYLEQVAALSLAPRRAVFPAYFGMWRQRLLGEGFSKIIETFGQEDGNHDLLDL